MNDEELPVLGHAETDEIFVDGGVEGRVRISREAPVTGVLERDSTHRYFLSPGEDYRGGGMGAVRAHDLPAFAKRKLVGREVKVAGVYEQRTGLRVEAIAAQGREFGDERAGR